MTILGYNLEERLTPEDVLRILEKHNIKPEFSKKSKPNELWFQTVCHGGDSHKLCFFKDSKRFFCYTNCGSMNFFQLLMKINDCSFKEALREVERELGINRRNEFADGPKTPEVKDNFREIMEAKIFDIDIINIKDYEDKSNILNYFDENTFYRGWLNEGISIETMKKYEIKWYELENYIIIPHRDINGRLIGIRRRSLKPEDANNKYMPLYMGEHLSFEHSLGMNLYGLDKNKEAIKRQRKVILVEGEKSVLLGSSYYDLEGKNNNIAVATCGFNVSDYQIELLSNLGVKEVILAFDKDFDPCKYNNEPKDSDEYKAFIKYRAKITSIGERISAKMRDVKVSIIWDNYHLLQEKDSPFDQGKDVLEMLLERRKFQGDYIRKLTEKEEQAKEEKEKQKKKKGFYSYGKTTLGSQKQGGFYQGDRLFGDYSKNSWGRRY